MLGYQYRWPATTNFLAVTGAPVVGPTPAPGVLQQQPLDPSQMNQDSLPQTFVSQNQPGPGQNALPHIDIGAPSPVTHPAGPVFQHPMPTSGFRHP